MGKEPDYPINLPQSVREGGRGENREGREERGEGREERGEGREEREEGKKILYVGRNDKRKT